MLFCGADQVRGDRPTAWRDVNTGPAQVVGVIFAQDKTGTVEALDRLGLRGLKRHDLSAQLTDGESVTALVGERGKGSPFQGRKSGGFHVVVEVVVHHMARNAKEIRQVAVEKRFRLGFSGGSG